MHRVSWLVWVVVVLVVSLGGSGALFLRCTKHSSLLSSLVWDGTEPLHCSGNDQISVTGVEATFTGGTAIVADGNCHVRCTDCNITAPTAIEASGNAQVTIIDGSVRGTSILASASGNARVMISGNVTVAGRLQERANGKVSAPPSPASPAVSATTPDPAPSPAAKAVRTPLPTKSHSTHK